MKKLVYLCIFFATKVFAQDPQFTQFFAAPLYHNPAFTGSGYAPRIILNYRNQWPAQNANFVTQMVSVDHFFEKINSGVGIMVLSDNIGNRIKNNEINGFYAYQLNLSKENHLRLGIQAAYSNRNLDAGGLIFGDQLGATGFNGQNSKDPLANPSNPNLSIFDVGSGALFYNSKSYVGVSVGHITQPTASFAVNGTGAVLRKYMLNAGYNINLNHLLQATPGIDKELTITPSLLYKKQGPFSQLDFGAYATYTPITLGLWYRGIPFKKFITKFPNQDSFSALMGFRFDNFSIGYSYDFTISGLGAGTGGSHEFSISYQLDKRDKDKTPYLKQRKKELLCPKF